MKIKQLTALCLSVLTLTSVNVSADQCCPSMCDGEWSVHADWLYWNARKCDLDYAWREEFTDPGAEIPNEIGVGPGKSVCTDYDSGFRLGLFRTLNDWKVGVRYTSYNSVQDASFYDAGLNYQASRVLPGTRNDSYSSQSYVESNFDYAAARYDIDLKVVDIEASKAFDMDCNSSMSVFSGVRFAFLDQDLNTVYGNKADILTDHTAVSESNNMDAYGLYIGGEGLWSFCGNFGFFGRFSIGTFVADISRSFHQYNLNSDNVFEVADVTDSSWCHVNAIEFALGIDYQLCSFFCADWNLRVGYEFNTWFNMHDFLNFCGTNAGIEGHPARQKDSVGFDGLFVRLGASF